jgi:DNA-3-methyladenine glycosylase I
MAAPLMAAAMDHQSEPVRCGWASGELSVRYHDEEWGVPVHDERTLFEFLILEGAQAGLSWNTILNKRNNYRTAFAGFDPGKVARYDRRKVEQLLRNPGIVRNKLKIASAIANAKAFLAVQKEFGSFDRYIWQFVDGKPRLNSPKSLKQVPARSPDSDANEQRSQATRLQLRRIHHLLRLHAGGGPGKRSPCRLVPLSCLRLIAQVFPSNYPVPGDQVFNP